MIADISHYQGEIDWTKARKELEMCIFRSSVGSNKDKNYLSYAKNCKLPFGVYHYVKAGTKTEAEKEAIFFYETATQEDIKPLFFVADIEYETQTKTTTKEVTLTFCNKLRNLGAQKIGLYIGQTRYPYIQDSLDKFDFIWIPRYGKNTGYADDNYKPKYPCDLWQYTSTGKIKGITGNVDLNRLNGTKNLDWFLSKNYKKEENIMAEKFTSSHFVEFCKSFLKMPYWYGCCVYNCTEDLYNRKSAQYPSHYTSGREAKYKTQIKEKKVCADCVGLIKGYAWTNGGEGVIEAIKTGKAIKNSYLSNNCPDKSANGMFAYAKAQGADWGTIDTIPEIPGIAVRYDGHVGIYIGNGYVIEERGFNYGCVQTKLKDRKWLHWYKIPFIIYNENELNNQKPNYIPDTSLLGGRLLKKGSKGEDVVQLQTLLKQLNFLKDQIDGIFGEKTETAVKDFQKSFQLQVDGKYGEKTHLALMEAIGDDEPDFEEDSNTPSNDINKKLEVIGNSVHIRKGDSTKYSIITTVNKGIKLTPIYDKENQPIVSKNNWYAIEQNGQIGWINGNYVK